MADLQIQKEFVEGINEIYTLLFNDGVTDGVYFFPLYIGTETNIYGECKKKSYLDPILLACKPSVSPVIPENSMKEVRATATFTVPRLQLTKNGLGISNEELKELRKGVMYFHGVYYNIDNVSPTTYIQDAFLVYQFHCTEVLNNESKPNYDWGLE